MSNIDPKNLSIRGLLGSDNPTTYSVPKNQRNFDWKKEHAEEMWEDIFSGEVFLGTIVLDRSENEDKITYIVDGQQRITTINILLAACRMKAKALGNREQALEIQRKLSLIKDTSGKSVGLPKLIVSKSIKDVFDATIANGEWEGKFEFKGKQRQVNRIKPIFNFFVDKLKKLNAEGLEQILENIYSSNFVAIYIDGTEQAFEIFERTNARGLELNAADLLKNFFYQKEVSDQIEETWDEIVKKSNGNILKLIKYYYVSINGYTPKKELFKRLKSYGKEKSPDILFGDIKDFAYYYYLVTAGSESEVLDWVTEADIGYLRNEGYHNQLVRALHAISLFEVTQVYPLIIAFIRVIEQFEDDKQKEYIKSLLRFIEAIEKFLFINYAVSQSPGNEIEMFMADKCQELAKLDVEHYSSKMKEITEELKEKLVGQASFLEKFSTLSWENDKTLIYYFFDRLTNFEKKISEKINIYNPDHRLLRKNYDCDHFIAQNYISFWGSTPALDDVIHSMGNMLVMARDTNNRLGDKEPLNKFSYLNEKQGHLPHIKQFIENWKDKDWSSPESAVQNIKERTAKLADQAFNLVWKM